MPLPKRTPAKRGEAAKKRAKRLRVATAKQFNKVTDAALAKASKFLGVGNVRTQGKNPERIKTFIGNVQRAASRGEEITKTERKATGLARSSSKQSLSGGRFVVPQVVKNVTQNVADKFKRKGVTPRKKKKSPRR